MDYVKAGRSDAISEGALVPLDVAGEKLLATRLAGTIHVTQRKCPHLGFNLCRGSLDHGSIVCPLHKAKFDVATGAIQRDPKLLFIGMKAKSGLKIYPVRELDGDLYVGV